MRRASFIMAVMFSIILMTASAEVIFIPRAASADILNAGYQDGKIEAIGEGMVTVSGKQYHIDKDCRVFYLERNPSGSYRQDPKTINDVYVGAIVIVKVDADTVYDILVKRYH